MLVLLLKGYGRNINFISETVNIPLLLLFSLFGFGGIFLKPLYSLWDGKSIFCSETSTQRSCWAKGVPMSALPPTHLMWELSPTLSMPQTQAGRGIPVLLRGSKAQRLPQHLLLRLVSLGLNSHADYNELQNLLILGRKEQKSLTTFTRGLCSPLGRFILFWLLSRSLLLISSTLRMKLSIWLYLPKKAILILPGVRGEITNEGRSHPSWLDTLLNPFLSASRICSLLKQKIIMHCLLSAQGSCKI